MTRLYVVEQSGLEPGGHYHAYTSCVVDGARQLGLDTVVLANKRLRAKDGALPPDIVPCFTYSWNEAELKGTLEWRDGNIAYEMFEAFRRVPPAVDDHVFLHTTGYVELRALLACLTAKLPGDPLPYFHLLLRRDPDILIENYRDYAEYFALLAASPYLRQKIRLYADTHLLSEAFAKVCGLPFATAPIPFDQSLLSQSLAARPARRPGDPLTIVYLGDAREEKGFQHLPQALSYLRKDYVAPGRARFVLQSNFNTPGGEPGILSASQNLAGFQSTILKSEPLQPAEYYQILADADVVLIPYSAQRYRYRSSGILVEAMSAGKVVVTSAGSWMATEVTPEHAVLFDTPADLGPAIAEAIDRFDALSAGAQSRREAALAHSTGASLVERLLAAAQPAAAGERASHRRVLLVMNGDAMVLHNGASRVAHAQLQYLTAAGYDVVGLFLTYGASENTEAFASWRAALARSIGPFPLQRVFVAGPGRWGSDPDQSPAIRAQRQHSGAPLKAEFEFVACFEFNGKLLQFLRTHPVDAVVLNYITNYPVVEALGLDGVPVICEMHDLQAFQRAIYGQRLVDPVDLDVEFEWLARCAALISLNPRETAIVRERLPRAIVETTGVFLPPTPPGLPSLAGAKDLAEIVSSTHPALPEYQFEAAWEIGNIASVQRLIEVGSIDLLYVSSAHMANVSGLKWFFSEVYEPFLAQHRVSMIVAGSICRVEGWPQHPRIFFVDQVEDLAPLYAAARVVVLPITEGAGSPVKTSEAFAYGRPIVGTSHAFRGLDGEPGEFIIRDDPRDFADAIRDLLNSVEERKEAAERSRHSAARCNDYTSYFRVMDDILGSVLGAEIEPTQPPQPRDQDQSFVEWSDPLQALNRVVRSYLDGEPLEGWALDLLAKDNEEDVDALLDSVSRSLLEVRDASVLRTEQRLKRYIANPLGSRLRENAEFAVRLALAERRGTPPALPEANGAIRAVACGGLPLTVADIAAGVAGDAGAIGPLIRGGLVVDGRAVNVRRVADTTRYVGQARVFQAEIPALDGDRTGLRTIELNAGTRGEGVARASIAVLRHSIPIIPGLQLLERNVFDPIFVMSSGGSGVDLPPGATGRLSLPRVVDGLNIGYIDLCFLRANTSVSIAPSMQHAVAFSVLLNDQPADFEVIGSGTVTLVRILLGVREFDDFGIVPLTIVNNSNRSALRLAAAYSGLLIGAVSEAAAVATALALAGQRSDQASSSQLTGLARQAIEMIVNGEPPDGPTLDALCAIATGPTGQDNLRALTAREASRASRPNGAARGMPADADTVFEDVAAIVGSCRGTGDAATVIVCPALPFDIVNESGQRAPAQTEAGQSNRGTSWRVPMPAPAARQRIRVTLDAALAVPHHPGLIRYSGFHPTDSPAAKFRWTGPETTATVTLPLALNHPATLVIELGATGKNTATSDFTIACNGRVAPHRFETDDHTAKLTAYLAPTPLAGPSTKIALTVRECFQQPPDLRILGVVFRTLSLFLGAPDEPGLLGAPLPAGAGKQGERLEPATQAIPAVRATAVVAPVIDGRKRAKPRRSNG